MKKAGEVYFEPTVTVVQRRQVPVSKARQIAHVVVEQRQTSRRTLTIRGGGRVGVRPGEHVPIGGLRHSASLSAAMRANERRFAEAREKRRAQETATTPKFAKGKRNSE